MFYQVIRHDATRDYLIKETDAPAYLIDLMQDKNKEIAAVCDACLDIISVSRAMTTLLVDLFWVLVSFEIIFVNFLKECNEDWKRRIMLDKFRFHNSHWLEMVESQSLDDAGFGMIEDDLPPYLSSDLMQHTMLYPSESRVSLEEMQGEEPSLDFSDGQRPFNR